MRAFAITASHRTSVYPADTMLYIARGYRTSPLDGSTFAQRNTLHKPEAAMKYPTGTTSSLAYYIRHMA